MDRYYGPNCDQVVNDLTKAITLDPRFAQSYLLLADLYEHQHQTAASPEDAAQALSQAVKTYRQLLKVDSKNEEALYRLGVLVDDSQEKASLFQKASEVNPADPRPHHDLALLLITQKRYEDATREYVTRLRLRPIGGREDGFDAMAFAMSLEYAGRDHDAMVVYNEILAATMGESGFERCYLFLRLDLHGYEAFPDFVAAINTLKPYCTHLEHYNQAIKLSRSGDYDAAIHELELQIADNPLYQETYVTLLQISKMHTGEAKALGAITKYLELEVDHSQRCQLYSRLRAHIRWARQPFMKQLKDECKPGMN